ncbi:SDR family oxidoreductase [Acaricomes phytoseiuli]|uniref:SDR family NAD(P)-dependent oxidoreductase n=1 Tax=Acaricomes phytoseiuli TaxID=291968 RepID=UPI002221B343|nr:SDR family oxidoreductase [Acaricomes phytoseiuli]MCW1249470.1 SDR family oxidoreductase [Acaricomes phytoseiuli]
MSFLDDLTGQTVLITGASSGIGSAYAEAFAARKADLVLVARRGDAMRKLAGTLSAGHGIKAAVVELDLTEPDAGKKLQAAHPEIDGLINNAGFGSYGTVAEQDTQDPERSLDEIQLNCSTVVDLTQTYLPGMLQRNRGFIVNIASVAAFQPLPRMAVYGASKAFVVAFTQALWKELEGTGVRALVVCPGATDTEFFAQSGSLDAFSGSNQRSVEDVIRTTFRALKRRRHTVVDGLANKAGAMLSSRLPRRWILPITEKLTRGTAAR